MIGKQVQEFHEKMGTGFGNRTVDDNVFMQQRLAMLTEEFDEYLKAVQERDPVALLDACVDLAYVVAGTAVHLFDGRAFDAAVAEVHRSNMSKDAPAVPFGKAVKGEGYSPPDLTAIVRAFEGPKREDPGTEVPGSS